MSPLIPVICNANVRRFALIALGITSVHAAPEIIVARPFPLSDVVWDYHVLGQGEGEFEVSLYAAKRDQVARMLKWMNDAGLDVAGVQIAPIALTNFARHDLDLRGTNVLFKTDGDNVKKYFLPNG